MRQKSRPEKQPAEDAIRDIRRATRRHFSAEERIRIVLEGLRGEESISATCTGHALALDAVRVRPSTSSLRPHRRRGSSAQHRARSPIAHRGHAAARERARRGRQRDRNTSDRPPMPMLRRPDDHHQYVRGRAPCAIAIANPDQN